jgi:hypothetical protein
VKLPNDIQNYDIELMPYRVVERRLQGKFDQIMTDFCCVALNQLPAECIRYDIDMAFYLPAHRHIQVEKRVDTANDIAMTQPVKKGAPSCE